MKKEKDYNKKFELIAKKLIESVSNKVDWEEVFKPKPPIKQQAATGSYTNGPTI